MTGRRGYLIRTLVREVLEGFKKRERGGNPEITHYLSGFHKLPKPATQCFSKGQGAQLARKRERRHWRNRGD